MTIAVVGKTLKKSCKFNAAARVLGDGAPRCILAPLVEGYMRCLSANCTDWRVRNPVLEPDSRVHGYPRTELLELARERAHSRFPGHALTPTGVMAIRCKQFHLPDL